MNGLRHGHRRKGVNYGVTGCHLSDDGVSTLLWPPFQYFSCYFRGCYDPYQRNQHSSG